MKYLVFFVTILIFGALLLLASEKPIQSFEQCVREGHIVFPQNPPRCVTDYDQVFFGLPQNLDSSQKSEQNSKQEKMSKKEIEKETPFDPLKNVHQKPLPKQVLLSVPFTPQAPHANWNPPFDEACEEAALLMVENISLEKNLLQIQLLKRFKNWWNGKKKTDIRLIFPQKKWQKSQNNIFYGKQPCILMTMFL
jgi:hypothetical protein